MCLIGRLDKCMSKSLLWPLVRKINTFSSRFSADGITPAVNSRSLMLAEAESCRRALIRNPSRCEASLHVCSTDVHYLDLYKEF